MAATELTVQTMTSNGTEVTFVSANAEGNYFINNGRTFLWVKNGDTSDHDVTIDSPNPCNQGFYHDVVITITAGEDRLIGVFDPARFNDSAGKVNITYSAVTGITIAAIKFI